MREKINEKNDKKTVEIDELDSRKALDDLLINEWEKLAILNKDEKK